MGELLKILHSHQRTYTVTPLNVVGATTSTTLRTVTAYDDTNCKHVRKFGLDYSISAITNAVIEHPRSAAGNAWTFDFQGWNGTAWVSMGTVADTGGASGAFAAGAAFTATKVKIVVTPDAGDTISITDGDHITLTTSADAGGLSVMLSGESMTSAFTLYLADSGSTYYDSALMYGGKRHTPTGTARLPYFHPVTAYAALGGAFTIVTILDSAHYQIDEWSVATASTTVQAALGQTPTLCSPIGASVYRDIIHDGNNSDTAYVASTGSDATGNGKWWTPYATHSAAFAAIGARAYINTQDAATFVENIALSAACTLEPIYGIVPTLQATTTGNNCIAITHGSISVSGYNITLSSKGIYATGAALNIAGTIANNTCWENTSYCISVFTITTLSGTIKNNICFDSSRGINIDTLTTLSGILSNNICYNNERGAYIGSITTISGTIKNVYCYNNQYGLFIDAIGTLSGIIRNCFIYNNTLYGFESNHLTTQTGTIREIISRENLIKDLYKWSENCTVTYTDYSTNSNVTIGAGCITTDPELCKITSPYKYGISTLRQALCTDPATESPYHTGTGLNSMGVITHGILLGADSITFDGIIFDGLDSYAHAIYCLATRTGTTFKWCTFQNYIGIAVDLYATAATSAIISNCWFKDNGQALALPYGSNTISYCIFSGNSKIGIWVDYTTNTFNHCVISGSEYGLYLDSNGSMILKNTIIDGNGLYGIDSEVFTLPTYICNTDAVNSSVDQSSTTNITDAPLMVDPDNNDFRIKTKEIGYKQESPCKGAADDGYDIGAYLYSYSVATDAWKKFVCTYNPRSMPEKYLRRGGLDFQDALGNASFWEISRRLLWSASWDGIAGDEAQRLALRHIASRQPGRESNLTNDDCKVRVSKRPTHFYGTGSYATVDATAKTLTDSAADYPPNSRKGWWTNIIFEHGTGAVDATAKTITDATKAWAVNTWAGYYVPYDGYYYYVLSNTFCALTVSDPYGTLIASASIAFKIVKPFKVVSHTETVLTLRDDDSELVGGSYDYEIDFMESLVVGDDFIYGQERYNDEDEDTKQDYSVDFIEVD